MPIGFGSLGVNLTTREACAVGGGSVPAGWKPINVEGTTPPCVNPRSCLSGETGGPRTPDRDTDTGRPAEVPRPTAKQLSPAPRSPQQRACKAANARLRALNARDVLEYAKDLETWKVDKNPYFLRRSTLERKIPEVKRLELTWHLKDCDGVSGLGPHW